MTSLFCVTHLWFLENHFKKTAPFFLSEKRYLIRAMEAIPHNTESTTHMGMLKANQLDNPAAGEEGVGGVSSNVVAGIA
jgi:hypothetical protein